jgi:glycosyltransferase involved in cell wall biosynthesis
VQELLPSARLYIVGADPPSEIQAYHAPARGVEVLGHVGDLSNLYKRVRVAVAPLRFGAGLKGKVVASLAVGLPCVVTSVACEGMPEGWQEAMIAANDAEEFARAIAHVHSDEKLWTRTSDAGVSYARENFSIEAVTEKIRALLQALDLPAGSTRDP